MRSIRFKLTIFSVLSMAIIVSMGFFGVYVFIRNHMLDEFDRSLVDRGHALAALVDWDEAGISFFDSDRATFSEDHAARQEYFRLFMANTKLRIDSPSILEMEFPEKPSGQSGVHVENWKPAHGPSLRLVHVPFSLDQEVGERHDEERSVAFGVDRREVHLILGWDASVVYDRLAYIQWLLVFAFGTTLGVTTLVLRQLIKTQLSPLVVLGRQLADISEQQLNQRFDGQGMPKEMQPVIQRLNQMMEKLEVAFDREKAFTSNAAHELRTPLAGLRSTMEVALTRERESSEYRHAIERSLEICNQMHPMVENLLALSRMEAGKMQMNPVSMNLRDELMAAWRSFESHAAGRGLAVRWQVPDDLTVTLDQTMFGMVATNLFDNATSYTASGQTIDVVVSQVGDKTCWSVSNPVGGMAPEDMVKIFDPFWRHDEARRQPGLHAGLGLSICRKIVAEFGGRIEASLSSDQRFVVTVTLPQI